MVFGNVEVAIMSGLEHGNETVKSSAEHWGASGICIRTPYIASAFFWVDLKYSRPLSTTFHEMAGIYSSRHELEIDVAATPILAHIC